MSRPFRPPCVRLQAGLTLTELMVSLALGLLVTLITTGLLLSTKSSYLVQDDQVQLHDSARYALEVIARALRQAAYEEWDSTSAPIVATAGTTANLAGLNAKRLKANGAALDAPVTPSVNGSDVLAVRFFGSGMAPDGDGTMLNCAGFSVPAPASHADAEEDRGWSIFYVGKAASGDLELYCKYRGKTAWTAQSIARGVESFQVLYGVDTHGDAMPDRYVHAQELDRMDAALVLEGENAAARRRDLNRKTFWKRVSVVRIALLMHGSHVARADRPVAEYDLFGKDYADLFASDDPGVRIRESALPAATRSRHRRVFGMTIQLRNRLSGESA